MNVDIATEITRNDQLQPSWDVQLTPRTQVSLSLLRWSYADLDFQAFHTFSGTVTMNPKLQIRNETGQQFRKAIYLDFPENKKCLIPGLGPGQTVDLNTVASSPIWIRVQRRAGDMTIENDEPPADARSLQGQAIFLKNLPYTGFLLDGLSHVFVGFGDDPTPQADVQGIPFAEDRYVLTVVGMDQPWSKLMTFARATTEAVGSTASA